MENRGYLECCGWQSHGEGLLYSLSGSWPIDGKKICGVSNSLWWISVTSLNRKTQRYTRSAMPSVCPFCFMYWCPVHNLVFLSDAGISVFETFCCRIPDGVYYVYICKFSSILIPVLLTPFFCFTNSVFICSINIVQNIRTAGELTSQFCFRVVEKTIPSSS
jgi:hypothetical protein